MLPDDWKKQIEDAAGEANRAANEQNHQLYENLFAKLNVILDQFRRYNDTEDRERPEKKRRENLTIKALFAAAIGTGALAAFSAWQAYETHEAFGPIQQTSTAALKQATAADKQVTTMQGQLDEMRLIRQPFVYFQNLQFEHDPNSIAQKVTIYAYPHWKNAGNSPTNRLRLIVFCNETGPSTFDYRQNGTLPRILGPQQVDGGGRCEITIEKIPEIAGVVGTMWIGGKATYFDDPGSKAVRITEFCQSASIVRVNTPTGFGIRAGMDGAQFCDVSPSRNCADADCPAEDRHE